MILIKIKILFQEKYQINHQIIYKSIKVK